jgi:hypothetical protein
MRRDLLGPITFWLWARFRPVIPGRAVWREPGIHSNSVRMLWESHREDRGYGFRTAATATSGMTAFNAA